MSAPIYNVLFLCTGNSARSIFAEAILNQLAGDRFRAFSAGSHPKGEVHPIALAHLKKLGLRWEVARSKSWDEYSKAGAPEMDFVFTLCDRAQQEACAIGWPGDPITAHWGIPDPAAAQGSKDEQTHAFNAAYLQIQNRIALFLALPLASIDRLSLHKRLTEIGKNQEITNAHESK